MGGTVAFLTDFGRTDWYAGVLHGVVNRISPESRTIDITHDINPGNIQQGAFVLSCARDDFPERTVFCCVVDPGVGSKRKAIVVDDGRHYFVGPDNGIFTPVIIDRQKECSVRIIENRDLFAPLVDPTFHGRDIFSPVSAFLSSGGDPEKIGPKIESGSIMLLNVFEPIQRSDREYELRVIYVDRFGNVFFNIRRNDFSSDVFGEDQSSRWQMRIGSNVITGLSRTFSDADIGKPLFYFGSCGYLELAVNRGNAAQEYHLSVDDVVTFVR